MKKLSPITNATMNIPVRLESRAMFKLAAALFVGAVVLSAIEANAQKAVR